MQKSDTDTSKVDSASLIDLKAELFRKQEEFKAQKLQSQNTGFIRGKPSTSYKKPSLFSKKNAGVTERAEKDYEEKVEEENVFERSRKALESKAKLYEKIASGTEISEEDGSGVFLVDFQKKNIDDFEKRLEKERKEKEEMERREIEEEEKQLAEPVPAPESEEEEWVDYVDAFGRSRRCLRIDLPDLQKQDESLQVKKRKIDEKVQKGCKDFQDLRDKSEDMPSLMSTDMKREMDRKRWEKQEMETMLEEKQGPIHYADVQHNEIRSHGVGFYKFDKDEEMRQEQMEQLKKLRQETKDERSKSQRIKEKRKAALAARLAKVKQRKREKLGLPETQEEENANSEEEIGPKIAEETKKEPEPLTRDDSWRSAVTSTREWDKGKHLTIERSEEAWLEKQRAEREEEFAPPSFYYDIAPAKKYPESGKKDKSNKLKTVTATGNVSLGNEMESVVEKQLNQLRKNIELGTYKKLESAENTQAETEYSLTNNTEGGNIVELQQQVSTDSVTSGFRAPIQSVPPLSTHLGTIVPNFSFPPPNVSVPPPNYQTPPPDIPNFQTPPPGIPNYQTPPPVIPNYQTPPPGIPNYQTPPPDINILPPNLNIPSPNLSIPPPNYSQHFSINTSSVGQSTPVSSFSNVPCSSNLQESESNTATTELNYASQINQNMVHEMGESRKKFVPKMDIVDTRLMDCEND